MAFGALDGIGIALGSERLLSTESDFTFASKN